MTLPSARTVWTGVGLLALVGLALAGLHRPGTLSDGSSSAPGRRARRFSTRVAEGFALRRHGYYGIDFVRCGKCRIEKRKLGPLTLGGFNVLVLEDLAVVLPDRGMRGASAGESGGGPHQLSARDIAGELGIDDSMLKANGWKTRFSGLKIIGLSVSTLDAATNVVPRFSAARAEARCDGLHLEDCTIVHDGQTNQTSSAVLKVSPTIRLEWASGQMELKGSF